MKLVEFLACRASKLRELRQMRFAKTVKLQRAIAKRKPGLFVMCDGGYATDNVADNFEQIWREYSPDTRRWVL